MNKFIEKVEAAYGIGAYDLSSVEFVGNDTPVIVVCPDHGPFSITPDNLVYNAGCKKCRGTNPRGYPIPVRGRYPGRGSKRGPKPKEYSLYIHDIGGQFLKVGITEDDVEKRRVAIERSSIYQHTVVYVKVFKTRKLCLAAEKLIKALYPMRVVPVGSMGDGSSETTYGRYMDEIIALIDSLPSEPKQ